MKKVVRVNFWEHLEDMVFMYQFEDVKYNKHIHVLLFDDLIEGVTKNLFDAYLKYK